MTRLKDRQSVEPETFVVDRSYLRAQAGEAFRMFVAPLNGVYGAAFGLKPARHIKDKKRV